MTLSRPTLLDAFSGAGGSACGYQLAGFHVTGIDIKAQPRYCGDRFIEGDALEYIAEHGREYDCLAASPPCQRFTAYQRRPNHVGPYPDLIAATRTALQATGRPYAIENVPGAPLRDPIQLCGSSFGLNVRRHRLFESNVFMLAPACAHEWQTPRFPQATNRTNLRRTVEVGVWRIPLQVQRAAMGIDWMELEELSEAIPPAYTKLIGAHLMAALSLAAAS